MSKHSRLTKVGLSFWSAVAVALTLSMLGTPPAYAHNLQTRMVYMFFDADTQACLDARLEGTPLPTGCLPLPVGWAPGDPLLQVNDELGLIIKVIPRDGTTTGVGGHVDFYIPDGVEVTDVAYVIPNGAGGFDKVAMKGQSPIAIGAGPIGAKTTPELGTLNDVYQSPVSDLSSTATTPSGLHLGTIAGVYGDTGIFYATDPDLSYGSWQRYTKANGGSATDWNDTNPSANNCGSLAIAALKNIVPNGRTITNNSGDVVVPCNKWDAEQLFGWGAKGTTYSGAALRGGLAIVDYPDQRGNAPWGFASGVAGPQSGYAWNFDWDAYKAAGGDPYTADNIKAGMRNTKIGPWKRIQYDGDRISYDQPGLASTVLGYANKDAGNLGIPVADLPVTTSQTDSTSPKAIRWAVGQLTSYRPEYVWVKIRVTNNTAGITGPDGCPQLRSDTFGGDAGGTDNGKDHLWRYYEPTEVRTNLCVMPGKPASEEFVKVGDIYQYPIKVYNLQDFPLTNVVVKDTLPSGVSYISAFPAQNSGPNPLVWNVGTLLPGQKFETLVTVKASGTGYIDNCMEITSDQLPPQSTCDTSISGSYPFLVPTKTARTTSLAPGGTVIYDILVKNIGEGPTGSPVTVREYLPTGFTYDSSYTPVVNVNGALVTATVDATNPNQPVFTVPAVIQANNQLTIAFRATASSSSGEYCNTYSVTQNGVPITTGSAACVVVGAGSIGDFVWRDWDGDGMQDVGEEGIPGVTVKLYVDDGDGIFEPGAGDTLSQTKVTDANGLYSFTGLTAATYWVAIDSGVPSGYVLTGDPQGALDGRALVVLPANGANSTIDFGYKPAGTAAINGTVFDDTNSNGSLNGGEPGISSVTVNLYEDTNGNGSIDAGDLLIATTVSNPGTGTYSFPNLAAGLDYIVDVVATDPDISTYYSSYPYGQTSPDTVAFTNLTGTSNTANFGFQDILPASVGDQVFVDINNNGVYDAGIDNPMANITVKLYLDANNDGVADAGEYVTEQSTDARGIYTFGGLAAGKYIVVVDRADPEIPSGVSAARSQWEVTLAAGDNVVTADFPFAQLLAKSVDKPFVNTGGDATARTVTYTVTPSYPGNDALGGVIVSDPIPTGTTYVTNSVNPGSDANNYVNDPTNDPPVRVEWELGDNAAATPGVFVFSGTTTLVLAPTADSYVRQESATSNFGTLPALNLQGEKNKVQRAFLKFDLSSIPSGSSIVSANLAVQKTGGDNASLAVNAHQVTGSWTDTGITWNNQPAYNATAASSTTVAGNGSYTWALASLAQGWFANAGTNNGVVLRFANEANKKAKAKNFQSWEGTPDTTDPKLTVVYSAATGKRTSVALDAGPSLIGGAGPHTVTVKMTVDVFQNTTGGTLTAPASLTVINTSGATVTLTSGPSPATATIPSGGGSAIFTYTYTVSNPTGIGQLTFAGKPTSNGTGFDVNGFPTTAQFDNGTSDSVIATKALSFKVLVPTSGAPAVIPNTAELDYNAEVVYSPPVNTATSASIGDLVWADLNGNGTYDAGEPGIAGVTVRLYNDPNNNGVIDSGETEVANQVTDVNGNYRFYGVTPGNHYTVTYDYAGPVVGYVPTTDSDADAGVTVHDVGTITAGLQYNAADFGLKPPQSPAGYTGSIGDYVWLDADSDGVQDADEKPLPGIIVNLYRDTNGNGVIDSGDTLVATTTTNVNGLYSFTGLAYGADSSNPIKYLVQVDEAASSVTLPNQYPGGPTTANLGTALDPTTGTSNPRSVSLYTGSANVTNADFGYNWSGAIGDYVWYDTNTDGLQNESPATPIANAFVMLYFDANNNGILDPANGDYQVGGMPTNASGIYQFTKLPPGPYLVDVYEDSMTTDGLRDVVPTTPNVQYVNLSAGQTVDTADFGYYQGARVEGNVFWDKDRNGLFDSSETGLGNGASQVLVTLTGTDMSGNTITKTTYTDSSGHFYFLVPEGNYTLIYNTSQTTSLGYPDATTVTTYSFHAYPGEDWHPVFDFGVDNNGSIGDRVWNDANGNGLQDTGEIGIANVTLNLYLDTDGNETTTGDQTLVATTATDGSGKYLFPGLPNTTSSQKYVVKVNTATLPSGYTAKGEGDPGTACGANCDNQIATTLTGGGAVTNVDFGYQPPASTYSVSGRVWNDQDGGGTQNGAETGIPNAQVCLYQSGGVTLVVCTTSAANGDYTFPGLSNGTYVVKVNPSTLPNASYVQTGDPDGVKDNQTTVTVNNANVTNRNFGYQQQLGSIAGTVCFGSGDGQCNTGETAIPSVTVTLTYAGPDGLFGTTDDTTQTTTTNTSGAYSFTNLVAGSYQIVETNPTGITSLADADGGNPDNIAVTLSAGQNVTKRDFEDKSNSIGDYVWYDTNRNGIQEAEEKGIAGVTVKLYDAAGTTLLQTTQTDGSGFYQFAGLATGNYQVEFGLPSGYQFTLQNQGSGSLADSFDSDANTTTGRVSVILTAGDNPTIDAGMYIPNANPARIGDQVWYDTNNNGVQDSGEPGLAGVTVKLRDSTGNTVLATMVTDGNGNYEFAGLPAGTYIVEFVAPSGYTRSPKEAGGNDNLDSDANVTTGRTDPITVTAGQNLSNVDAGMYIAGQNPASIGDRVWYDTNNNGVQNGGEPGIPGVVVKLYNSSGILVATTQTDASGNYSFGGLAAGNYQVQFVAPVGYSISPLDQGGNDALDSDANPTTGYTATISLAAGQSLTTVDAGMSIPGQQPITIGDFVWLDGNNNLLPDTGEGLANAQVVLYDNLGNELARITTNATDTNYTFTGVGQGSYRVEVDTSTLPANATEIADPDTVFDSATDLINQTSSINTVDFGYSTNIDYGDLPDSYKTLLASNGARHIIKGVYLGTGVTDAESDGQPTANATGDNLNGSTPNDENGVVFNGALLPGQTTQLTVTASATGILNAWADWNNSGTFDSDEQIFTNTLLVTGPNVLTVNVPAGAVVGPTAMRFRVTDQAGQGGSSPTGLATSGEVEDYRPSVLNPTQTGTVTGVVFIDNNGNGTYESGIDTPLSGVAVVITDSQGGMQTVTTGPTGGYSATVAGGNTTVDVNDATLPAGATLAPGGGNSDPTTVLVPVNGTATDNTGYVLPTNTGLVNGVVYKDVNNDGLYTAGTDLPLPNVDVVISNGTTSYTVVTNAAGYFQQPVTPGTWTVDVNTADPDFPSGLTLTTNANNQGSDPTTVTVPSGRAATDNTGYRDPPPAQVGNLVWYDVNNNGAVDNSETGIAGVQVELLNSSGGWVDNPNQSGTQPYVVFTDASGLYQFTGLPAGAYRIRISQSNFDSDRTSPGVLYTLDYLKSSCITDANDNQEDNDDNGIEQTGNCENSIGYAVTSPVIVLSSGETDLTIDFGFTKPATTTTPVSLSYFRTVGDNGRVTFEWATATEAGNIGFSLYVWQEGDWVELASLPSSVIDSVEETAYRYEASGVTGDQFAVVDIDRFGQETVHGPFKLNQSYGWSPEQAFASETDWEAIGAEYGAKQADLQKARKAQQQQLLDSQL